MGRTCVFDIEGNDLLPGLTTIHCAVAIDVDTGEVFSWKPEEMLAALAFFSNECECLIGHNILDYDFRAMERIYPSAFKRPKGRYDTLLMARIIWPTDTLIGRDMKLYERGKLPGRLIKSQSLEAWGYRLGVHKAGFEGPWDKWTQEMHDYMIQDGHVTLALWRLIRKRLGWDQRDKAEYDPGGPVYTWPQLPFDIEHACAEIVLEQQETGFAFDKAAAVKFSKELLNTQADLETQLSAIFGEWWGWLDDPHRGKAPKRTMRRNLFSLVAAGLARKGATEDYSTDAPFVRIKRVSFAANSRDHLGKRLQDLYGWKPTKYGKSGRPTIDETTLDAIPPDVLPPTVKGLLSNYFVVTKTLGMVSLGGKSWLGLVGDDNRMHGRINTAGAITGRATHSNPNMSINPAVQIGDDGKPILGVAGGFGYECRSLFTASEGNELTGTDVASLELALLGHYLAPFDEGAFAERMSDVSIDPHTENGNITGLNRRDTKTVTYLTIFGGGAEKCGSALDLADEEIEALAKHPKLKGLLRWKKRVEGDAYREPTDREKARMAKGAIVLEKFYKGISGLKDLKDRMMKVGKVRGWVKGLDGRKLYVRKPHATLNTALQGGGSIVCKLWMVKLHERLKEEGLTFPFTTIQRIAQVAWSHDELQFDHEPGLGPTIKRLSQEALNETREILGIRPALRCDAKTGRTWAETH